MQKFTTYFIIGLSALCLTTTNTFSQQLKLGKNPSVVEKSAVLELESNNQGLLFPRITDTVLINIMNPSAGMVIYHVPSKQLMLRANNRWNSLGTPTIDTSSIANFYTKVRSLTTAAAPITLTNGQIGIAKATGSVNGYLSSGDWTTFNNKLSTVDTGNIANFYTKVRSVLAAVGPVTFSNGQIGITQASASNGGYLSSADWNTFNNKAGTITQGNLTENVSGVLTITGGVGAVVGSGASIQVKQASTSQSGFLSNADWNTFNSKLSAIDTSNIANFYTKVRSLNTAAAPITLTNGQIAIAKATGSVNGYLSSADWTTFNNKLSTVDTGNITNFSTKVRSLFTTNGPVSFTNGLIGMTQASASTAGYLSAADWVTFNNKLSAASSYWSKTGDAGTNSSTNFIGTTDNQDLVFRANNVERARIVSSSGDLKIGDATSGTIRSTTELVFRQDGDVYGSSILRLRNRNAENGAIFETTDPTTTLVDFIFKTAASQRNIRYEARASMARVGTPAFHIGGASPDDPSLAVGDSYSAFNTNLKIGNYIAPTEALDIAGNLKFSGALMPNNSAGTTGQFLKSNGSGNAPTWTTIDTTNIASFFTKVRSLFSAGSGVSYNAATGVITATGGAGSGWSLSGNSGISNSFLGSTDNTPLIFKVNNAQVGRFDANNVALGASAQVQGVTNSLALGSSTYVSSNNAIAIGNGAQAQGGSENIAIGKSAYVSTSNSIAMGNTAQAQGAAAIVLGQSAYGSGTNSIVIGANSAKAQNTSAIAIGPATISTGSASISVGENAQSQAASAVVIGKNAYASGANSVSIGGTEASSTKALGAGSIALGNAAIANNAAGIAIGNNAVANTQSGIAFGNGATSSGTSTMSIGDGATASGNGSLALGNNAATSFYTNSTAIGVNATVARNNSIVLGDVSNSSLNVGIGLNAPAAKLDVEGTVKLGASGSVTKNLVNFEYDLPSAVTVPKTTGTYTTGAYDMTITIPSGNTLSSTRGAVTVSFNQDLPTGVSVASARVVSTTSVRVRFLNHNTGATASLPNTLNVYISIVEF